MIEWNKIYGWGDFTPIHRHVFQQLPDGATVVELGVGYGRGLACMVSLVKQMSRRFHVVGVDRFIRTEAYTADGFSELSAAYARQQMESVGVGERDYALFVMDSADAAELCDPVDYVFLDADHEYLGVKRDIDSWLPKIRPGGFIGGHDWDFHGVNKAVLERWPNPALFTENYCNCWLQKV